MRKPYAGNQPITSEFGYRDLDGDPSNGKENYHTGIDIGYYGDVLAAAEGYVIGLSTAGRVDANPTIDTPANYVIIQHEGGLQTLYWHLSVVSVSLGQRVSEGQKIGVTGKTGWAYGIHLHFGVKLNGVAVNPRNYIDFNSESSNNLSVNSSTMEFITIPQNSGWGLSHVAQLAGYSDAQYPSAWQRIATLNGYSDWHNLQAKFDNGSIAGQTLRVREAATVAAPVADTKEITELKKQVANLTQTIQDNNKKADDAYQALKTASAAQEEAIKQEAQKKYDELSNTKTLLEDKLADVNKELGDLEAHSVRLPEASELADVLTNVIVEEAKARGIKAKWHAFVDAHVKSDYLKSLLKYDWFYLVAGFIAIFSALAAAYQGENAVVLGIISVWGTIAGQVMKYLVTNNDKNGDGKIDINDLNLVDYIKSAQSDQK